MAFYLKLTLKLFFYTSELVQMNTTTSWIFWDKYVSLNQNIMFSFFCNLMQFSTITSTNKTIHVWSCGSRHININTIKQAWRLFWMSFIIISTRIIKWFSCVGFFPRSIFDLSLIINSFSIRFIPELMTVFNTWTEIRFLFLKESFPLWRQTIHM